jgi:hypothetical protein
MIKIINFMKFMPFQRLKENMGLSADKVGTIRSVPVRVGGVTWEENQQLETSGLEVDISDVEFLPDGTIAFKDRRVILYIRDALYGTWYGKDPSDPKFHVASCDTLDKMKKSGRFKQRYVVASRDDGIFILHYPSRVDPIEKKLDVCQNCLSHLSYRGFGFGANTKHTRKSAVETFSIAEFFQEYPKNLHKDKPLYTDMTAPINRYPDNFNQLSLAYREKRNWLCEECGINLNETNLRKYLHVHHINHQRNENQESNLRALCLRCHAAQADHQFMQYTAQYREFTAHLTKIGFRA